MGAVRLLHKQTVTKKLRDEGCERIDQADIPDHSYWKSASGFHFYVPEVGPDKMTPDYVLYEIIADVAKHTVTAKKKT